MKVLGIDTSTAVVSIGIIEDESVIAESSLNVMASHSAKLMSVIDDVLKRSALTIQELDAFAVTIGPGSFTGLRIGLSTVKGFCYALKKPIIGVITLDVLAYSLKYSDKLICPILDARKQEVYSAIYRGGSKLVRQTDYLCTKIESILASLNEPTIFLGDGVARYKEIIVQNLNNHAIIAESPFRFCRGPIVALLGYERLISGESDDYFAITPFYIRKPEAEVRMGSKGKASMQTNY
jgi:tRNA threonylcarbamoyladenosine biosynthesis protein TsaB